MTENARRCSHAGFWAGIAVLAILLAGSFVLNLGLGARLLSRRAARLPTRGVEEAPAFREVHLHGTGRAKAVRIPVSGILTRQPEGGLFRPSMDRTELLLRQIQAATNDRAVGAILLEIDSPGGAVTPVDEIHGALRRFRESRPDRRIVVYVRDIAASGGFYVAVAGDRIVAEPTAVLGSISVILQTLNWHELSERIGVRDTTIVSGRNKDLLNPFREVDPEHLAMLQAIVDHLHARFSQLVQQGRGLTEAELAAVTDGRILTAADALDRKLIDRIGSRTEAIELVHELLDHRDVRFVRYEHSVRWGDWLGRLQGPDGVALLPRPRPPRFAYLWQP